MSGHPDSPHWPEGAQRLIDRAEISQALDDQARRVETRLQGHERVTLMVLMNGGMYPAVALSSRIKRPLLFDHVHASRYRGQTSGGEIKWGRWPDSVIGTILLVDDIFDEGYTMQAVRHRLLAEGAEEVITVSLTVKQHDRGLARDWIDDAALSVPDRYVFGCGMDWHGYWRQLDEIWALGE
ncbi:MAG: hypoxanthine-guanine phosphoribosyltransferase [Wenzhouxiangella sp.]|nr:MAG: hypoxanthine-guanine phosphoribosyltransferase [Wenzhouxiangella sp.]